MGLRFPYFPILHPCPALPPFPALHQSAAPQQYSVAVLQVLYNTIPLHTPAPPL